MAKIKTSFKNTSYTIEQTGAHITIKKKAKGKDPDVVKVPPEEMYAWCMNEFQQKKDAEKTDRVRKLLDADYAKGMHLYGLTYQVDDTSYQEVFVRSKVSDPSIADLKKMQPGIKDARILMVTDYTDQPVEDYVNEMFKDYEKWPVLE